MGIAVAAHIYAARPGGPRPPPGEMTPEQVKHISNGIWMCRTHGGIIDDFQFEYPPVLVLNMKRVRECAQHLAVTNATIAWFYGWMGVNPLDQIVRNHLPGLDTTAITQEVMRVGTHWLSLYLQNEDKLALHPSKAFAIKTLPEALRDAGSDYLAASTKGEHYFQSLLARDITATFVQACIETYKLKDHEKVLHANNGHARIAVRNPVTGEISEFGYSMRSMMICKNNSESAKQEEIFLRVLCTRGFTWDLEVTLSKGVLTTRSELNLRWFIEIRDSQNRSEREQFENYAKVLDALAQGWIPVGFVGMRPDDDLNVEDLHPTPFDIDQTITPETLVKALARTRRIRLAYEIGDRYDAQVLIGELLTNLTIDEEKIREAAEILFANQDGKAYLESPPLHVYAERRAIVMYYRRGVFGLVHRVLPPPSTAE